MPTAVTRTNLMLTSMAARSAIKVIFRGKEYFGEYEVSGRTLRVFFEGRVRIGLVRGSNPEFLALLFLIELVSGV